MGIRVPRRNDNGVTQQALPGVRVNESAPIEAFGGGASAAAPFQAAGQIADTAAKIQEAETKRADDAWSMEYAAKLKKSKNDLMYGENGAMKKEKKDAFGVVEEYGQQFDKIADSYEGKDITAGQSAIAKKIRLQIGGELQEDLTRHRFGETRKYEEDVTKTLVDTEQDNAVQNYQIPGRVQDSLVKQAAAIRSLSAKHGDTKEQADLKVADAASATHTAVINRMLANGNDLNAKAYYEANRAQITRKEDVLSLERNLMEGSTRGESQRKADAFWAQSGGDMKTALGMTKGLDPKVREATESRIRQMASDQHQAENLSQEKAYESASAIIANRSGYAARAAIPPHIFNKMNPAQQEAVLKRAEEVPHDNNKWLSFLELDAKQVANMSRTDFETKYWTHFDKEHRAKAETQWNAARDAKINPKKEFDFKSIKSDKEMILDTLKNSKLSGFNDKDTFTTIQKNTSKAKLYNQAEDAADLAFQKHFQETGKMPNDMVKQQIIGDILRKTVFVKKTNLYIDALARDKEVPLGLISEDDKGAVYIPIDKIPSDEQKAIKNILRSKGKAVTEDKIQRAYGAYVTGNRALYMQILGEK